VTRPLPGLVAPSRQARAAVRDRLEALLADTVSGTPVPPSESAVAATQRAQREAQAAREQSAADVAAAAAAERQRQVAVAEAERDRQRAAAAAAEAERDRARAAAAAAEASQLLLLSRSRLGVADARRGAGGVVRWALFVQLQQQCVPLLRWRGTPTRWCPVCVLCRR
jgi:regulator of protease activity HflC (stomatin/prohibitin superfamily)